MNEQKLQGSLRKKILDLHYKANSGHIGCSLSCIDLMIVAWMYRNDGDSFILSKGHAATALYAIMNATGDISDLYLETFYKNGTALPAHPAAQKFASIPLATGSLGHGLPLAAGIAKANKLKRIEKISYVLMSDGETNEGTTWEAGHFAATHGLDNLVVFVDRNQLQGFGNTREILGDTAAPALWVALGFEVWEADGHDIPTLVAARDQAIASKNGKPKVIVANTTKGSGVGYMEHKMEWHYLPMNEEQYKQAVEDIEIRFGV